jgi:hypothetical protein
MSESDDPLAGYDATLELARYAAEKVRDREILQLWHERGEQSALVKRDDTIPDGVVQKGEGGTFLVSYRTASRDPDLARRDVIVVDWRGEQVVVVVEPDARFDAGPAFRPTSLSDDFNLGD